MTGVQVGSFASTGHSHPPDLIWRVVGGEPRVRTRAGTTIIETPKNHVLTELRSAPPSRQAVEDLVQTDRPGVITLADGSGLIAFVPAWSGQRLYWAIDDDIVLLSTSARSIAGAVGPRLNRNSLAATLIGTLPLGISMRLSPWSGVHAAAPFEMLHVDQNFAAHLIPVAPRIDPIADDEAIEEGIAQLRKSLMEAVHYRIRSSAAVTCDISGGVDSAANAYMLRALHRGFNVTRARAHSKWNLDDRWAERIVNDLHLPLIEYPSIGSTSFAYDATSPYAYGNVPETPINWSDTEGYVRSLARRRNRHARIQFTGLGGDELFSALPALAWSLVRELPLSSPRMAIRYCLNYRIPLRRGIPSLANRTGYGEHLEQCLRDLAADGKTPDDQLAWTAGAVSFPSCMSEEAKGLSLDLPFDPGGIQPLNRDRTVHQALESLLGQANITRQLNDMFPESRTTWTSPFLDPRVIRAALALPMRMREHPFLNKPMLYKAMRGFMPREIFARTTKGEYTSESYSAIQRDRGRLLEDLTGGALADLGLVDPKKLKTRFSMKLLSSEFLFELQRLSAVERWVRNVL